MQRLQRLSAQTLRWKTTFPKASPFPSQTLFTPVLKQSIPQFRLSSTEPAFPNASPRALPHKPAPHRNPDEPIYQLTFTCKKCLNRSSHTVSKQGYHRGTVLITCPGCKNRHLISDHLKIFSDTKVTIEDIMEKQGEAVQRGSISPDGDVEFWDKEAKAAGEE